MRGLPILLLLASGCLSLQVSRTKNDQDKTVVIPHADGSRYVSVESGPMTSASTLRRRWSREAAKSCDGDHMVLSDGPLTRRRGRLTTKRFHEGFVRCVSPEAEPKAEPRA